MGLAPRFVEEIFRIISEFKAEQRTILLVEQNARAALESPMRPTCSKAAASRFRGRRPVANDASVVAAYLGGARIMLNPRNSSSRLPCRALRALDLLDAVRALVVGKDSSVTMRAGRL